jgi:hypothetical protein
MSTIRINIFAVVLFISCSAVMGQEESTAISDPWPEITDALASGDARSLAHHFSSMVDLGLPEKDDTYSKSQGEIIMRDFFKKCPAESFNVVKKGKISENSHFAICSYRTKDKSYQVSVHLQAEKQTFLITKIKFENQEL